MAPAPTPGPATGIGRRYLISSTKQISPKVLKALKGNRGAAGAAGAIGATRKEGPHGKEGKVGKEGAAATTLFARVKSDGTLQKGSGVVSAAEKQPVETADTPEGGGLGTVTTAKPFHLAVFC